MSDNAKEALSKRVLESLSSSGRRLFLRRGIELADTLQVDRNLAKLIEDIKEVSDWEKRSQAWTEIRLAARFACTRCSGIFDSLAMAS